MARNHPWPPELLGDLNQIASGVLVAVRVPAGARTTVSPQFHAGDTVTSVGDERGEEAVGATDVSDAWRHHQQWPICDYVVGEAPLLVSTYSV